jgi:Na+-transporting NADH:ubiquinone oxidoreductase subunit F
MGDYSLTGRDTAFAIDQGLADAQWYKSPIAKSELRPLLQRRNGPAIRDTLIWLGLLTGTGVWGFFWWGGPLAIIPFLLYGILYASASDSRWHEAGHGTAFRTTWMNEALYELASFMVLRESIPWRWSHTRHHSDTLIVGRDPEIAVPRPPSLMKFALSFLGLPSLLAYVSTVSLHCVGKLTAAEHTYIPEDQHSAVFWHARIYALIYLGAIAACILGASILPLMYIGLPNLYGAWWMPVYGFTQHAGLPENVLDHRLNCRTVEMNIVNRFLYSNMNYHVEHHMYPSVPYHSLPKLHELLKNDMPIPYRGLAAAWREIIPTVLRQRRDPSYHVQRVLPRSAGTSRDAVAMPVFTAEGRPMVDGWIEVGGCALLEREDAIRFDHAGRTYAIYRTSDDQFFASDGICTHGNTHLAGGMLKGRIIECPKHNGRFDIRDGSPQRLPACVAIKTYPVKVTRGRVLMKLTSDSPTDPHLKTHRFEVLRNTNVTPFIKELVLRPETAHFRYQPGDFLQLDIPPYESILFSQFDIPQTFADLWHQQGLFDLSARNEQSMRRNYSMASNPSVDGELRFNVRIALPPQGRARNAGLGSAYVFNLKPGDLVTAVGPQGTFHIKDTHREMVYLGGGAGMAPLRSHLSHLFDTLGTQRAVSYWYGARSSQELYYHDYFAGLARRHSNFKFHVALSDAPMGDSSPSHKGFIHQALRDQYLHGHRQISQVEFYLCGPPPMIKAGTEMLRTLGVRSEQVAYDEFS